MHDITIKKLPFKKKGKKNATSLRIGGNTTVLTQMVVALIITTQKK